MLWVHILLTQTVAVFFIVLNSNIATGKFIVLIMILLRKTRLHCVLFKDLNLSFSVIRRQDFIFMDDFLAEGLLRLCVHLVKVSSFLITVISPVFKHPTFLFSMCTCKFKVLADCKEGLLKP